uniref:Uncharacterized protein n=1 Tax=Mycena chlorophos TaxID=658473 RepID=A0ABQ0LWX6_MYCCL|nr:predicted protein [Mycena chlorophos]
MAHSSSERMECCVVDESRFKIRLDLHQTELLSLRELLVCLGQNPPRVKQLINSPIRQRRACAFTNKAALGSQSLLSFTSTDHPNSEQDSVCKYSMLYASATLDGGQPTGNRDARAVRGPPAVRHARKWTSTDLQKSSNERSVAAPPRRC